MSNKRFEIIEKESQGISKEISILRDKVTGVNYVFFLSGYGGGLTPLLDRDGKPIVTQ